jgi:hypothetical protein
VHHERCARCIEVWDIESDVIRGREFDLRHKFLPDALSLVNELTFERSAPRMHAPTLRRQP